MRENKTKLQINAEYRTSEEKGEETKEKKYFPAFFFAVSKENKLEKKINKG